jgi:adenylate cyclase
VPFRGPRPSGTPEDARAVTVGIGFVDLVGSTEWSSALSLEEHADALTRFESAAWDFATANHGRVVKLIGDEAMFVAPTGIDATRIARELCRFARRERSLPEARGATGYGPVGSRDGDYFGPLVNLVARALQLGQPSSVVVTAEVRSELEHSATAGENWVVSELPTQALRGFDDSFPLYTVH